jgi:hypothetical protein
MTLYTPGWNNAPIDASYTGYIIAPIEAFYTG